jgi:16S rRNA processing protein RimM
LSKSPGPDRKDRIAVGALAGAFGVHGEVRLKSYCADPMAIADYGPLHTEDGTSYSQIVFTGQAPNALIARVQGIISKEQADALKGQLLYADRDRLPPLEDEEYYYSDLIGLAVQDTGGNALGTVRAVHNHGAGDLIEVIGSGKSATILLPFTRAVVPTVDLAARRIVVDPPEGLL